MGAPERIRFDLEDGVFRLPLKVVDGTLICDRTGRVVADTSRPGNCRPNSTAQRIVALVNLQAKAVAPRFASPTIAPPRVPDSIQVVVATVAAFFMRSPDEIFGCRKPKSLAWPRLVCYHFARKHTNLSLVEIAESLGRKDHTTVLYGIRQVAEQSAKFPAVRAQLEVIEAGLSRQLAGHEPAFIPPDGRAVPNAPAGTAGVR